MLLACATNLWAETEVIYKNEGAAGTVNGITATGNVNNNNGNPAPSMACTTEKNTTFTFSGFQLTEYTNLTLKLDVKKDFASTTNTWPYITVTTYLNDKEVMTDNTTISWSEKANVYTTFTLSSLQPFDKITLVCSPAIGTSSKGKPSTVYNCYIDNITLTGERASSATLQSIEITGEPTKKDYMAGEAFSTDGLKVMGNYDDDTKKEITEGITWTVTPATLTAGLTQVSVTATAEGKSTTRTITGLTVTAAKTLTSIAVSGTPAEFWKDGTFNHNGMTVTAKWDDNSTTDVTTEATFSTPDMTTAGTKTITVTYKEKTTTYDITVKTIANTQETAYTVAEAIALIEAGNDLTTEVFVKGTISKIDGYNSTYKSITYWLDDNSFEVYSGKGLNKADFNSIYDIAVGGEVIVYGIIKEYNSTYEFDKNNYLVYYKAPAGEKEVATITLNGNKTEMESTEEDNEYTVTYNGDGELSITSSNEAVAVAIIVGKDVVVDVLSIGTTTITISASGTENYYAAEEKYTLTVVPAWVAASLPFTFDGGNSSIDPGNGIKQSGLGSDYGSSPKLKFGETGASLIIWFNETAASVSYSIKGNPSSGTWSGTFDVLESEDNQKYDTLATYVNLTTTKLTETKTLSSSTRYIKFVYSKKVLGNVALGAIKIVKPSTPSAISSAVVETPAVKTIENGQLVIIRDGVKYNAMGVRL